MWLNGFLAGLFSDAGETGTLPAAESAPKTPLLLLFGSQTGTAERLAKQTAKFAQTRGFAPRVVSMEQYETLDWAKEQNVLVIASTYGDGEPPDPAQAFWNWIKADTAPRLEHLQYSVLALGDTNYAQFCQFGKNCDERLSALGAKRVFNRKDCDVDYEAPAQEWTEGVFSKLVPDAAAAPAIAIAPPETKQSAVHDRKNPFPAKLLRNLKLSREGSAKDVRHFELSLQDSGLSYEVGDALGVFPSNCPVLVSEILTALDCDGEEAVQAGGRELSLRLALTQHFDITKPSNELLAAAAERSPDSELSQLLDPSRKDEFKRWLYGREIIDVLLTLSSRFAPAELIALLKKLAPRLYSISSSAKAHPDEVHLTVSAVRYETHGRARKGVASTFLADRVGEGTASVFVQPSPGFKPPADPNTPMIMIGPGTGIAPFRAFLEERQAIGAKGRNWLLFGDQRRSSDFLYEDQILGWCRDGLLSRLDLAFSRDQEEKIYVQTRMLESAKELWAWLEDGAHFYVCGDASRMAKDVDQALHTIIERSGGRGVDEAKAYVAKLKSDKRYQRDVY